jgi:hypothetical protein
LNASSIIPFLKIWYACRAGAVIPAFESNFMKKIFQSIAILSVVSLGLMAGPTSGSCTILSELLQREFRLEAEIDLSRDGLEQARARLNEGDVGGCREEIIAYFLAHAPAGSLSAWPAADDALERAEGILKNEYRLGLHRSYPLGEDLSWDENPGGLDNWGYLLHAFEFQRNVTEAYRITHDERYLIRSKALILDFIGDNFDAERLPSDYAWFDHSVAYRSIYFIDFWNQYVEWDEMDESFGLRFIDLIWRQALCLAGDDFYSRETNHGIFSDIALLRIALAFPEFRESAGWAALATARIERQVRENFSPDGVHQEYAPAYHILTAKLLCRFIQDARGAGGEFISGEIDEKLRKIIAYIPYLFHPDGTISLFGDTFLESAEQLLKPLIPQSPAVQYVYSGGGEGRSPEEASKAFHDGQMYIMRSGWGEERPYGEESYLIADFGPFGNAHQHFDFMSFEFSAKGARWITDLGPFNYTSGPKRHYIQSANAHNTVVPYAKMRSRAGINDISAQYERRYRTAKLKLQRITGKYEPGRQITAYEELLREYADVIEDEIRMLLAYTCQQIEGGEEEAKTHLIKVINKGPSGKYFTAANEMYATLGTVGFKPGLEVPARSEDAGEIEAGESAEGTLVRDSADASYFMPVNRLNHTLRSSSPVPADNKRTPAVDYWMSEPDFDYLEGRFQYAQFFEHTRAILFIKPYYFLVVDRIAVNRNCIVKSFFHMPPAVEVRRSGGDYILSVDDSLRCIMKEISVPSFRVSRILKGSSEGEYQGWYGGSYNSFEPAPAVEITVAVKEGYLTLSHLFVPVGTDSVTEYTIRVDNEERWNPASNLPLELTIEEPGYRTNIHYLPSSKFCDSDGGRLTEKPDIRIIRTRF